MPQEPSFPSPLSYQPIVVIGAARSGTKLLRDLIALHPLVARVPYDVNFIWHYGNLDVHHDELTHAHLTGRIGEGIVRRLGRFAGGRPYLVEKTVGNCLRIPFVKAVFPSARFIHLLRDGADVVESVFRQWLAPPEFGYLLRKARSFPLRDIFRYSLSYAANTFRRSRLAGHKKSGTWGVRYRSIDQDLTHMQVLEVCAVQWRLCVEKARADLDAIPPGQFLTLKYEDLVLHPERQLNRIGEFIGMGPGAFDPYRTRIPVSTSNIGKGRKKLSPRQIELIAPQLNPLLLELGYPSLSVESSEGRGAPDTDRSASPTPD